MGFGYIGSEPTNDNTENNGVFTVEELNDLEQEGNLKSSSFSCDFLVVAGGGGAGIGASGNFGGGGGAGGVCSSVQSQGGGNTLDSALTLSTGIDYEVAVGAGGASSNNAMVGGNSQFHTVKAMGGGRGWRSNRAGAGGSAGGGGRAFNWTAYARSPVRAMSETDRLEVFGSRAAQGSDGNNTGYESYNSSGGGGGASGSRGTQVEGSNGIRVEIASATNAGSSGVGEIKSTNQVWFGGGGGAGANHNTNGGNGGGGNGSTNSSNSGDANTGGGGGGDNGTGGSGGSGCVVIKYPDTFTCTAGTGVTGTEYDEGTGYKTFHITSGDGTISFSKG